MAIDWRILLMSAMARRGYTSADMRDAVRYAERWGKLWGCPVLTPDHRAELAWVVPDRHPLPAFDGAHAATDVDVDVAGPVVGPVS